MPSVHGGISGERNRSQRTDGRRQVGLIHGISEASKNGIRLRGPGVGTGRALIGRTVRRPLLVGLVPVLVFAFTRHSQAQTNGQLWGTFTLNWLKSSRLSYELEIEPKLLVAAPEGESNWASVDVTPNVERALRTWLDMIGELATGYTSEADHADSFELSPRVGVRFHLTTRDLPTGPLKRERLPRHRIVVSNLVRVEWRNLFYTGTTPDDSVVRFRNRLELRVPLNRERMTDDGARYLLTDWEWFVPLDDPQERFANRQRIRTGIGYRRNRTWHFEALYIWTRSRDTTDENFRTSDNIVDLRLKRVF